MLFEVSVCSLSDLAKYNVPTSLSRYVIKVLFILNSDHKWAETTE
jgi:hypothetical protein